MRIGFFGGSFDPPHRGHLAIARAARERLALDRVLLAPAGLQPLKRAALPSSFADRLAMLRLLAENHAGIETSDIDAPRPDGRPNYSYDTLLRLRRQLGLAAPPDQRPRGADDGEAPDVKVFMLLGADSFLTIRQWYRASDLLMLCDWIVATRPGFSLEEMADALPDGIERLGEARVHEAYTEQALGDGTGRRSLLYLLTDLHEDVSATAIRAAVAGGAGLDIPEAMLLPDITAYIREHRLYERGESQPRDAHTVR